MQKPDYIELIIDRTCECFRLKYNLGNTTIKSQGFRTKEELIKVLKNDNTFKIQYRE